MDLEGSNETPPRRRFSQQDHHHPALFSQDEGDPAIPKVRQPIDEEDEMNENERDPPLPQPSAPETTDRENASHVRQQSLSEIPGTSDNSVTEAPQQQAAVASTRQISILWYLVTAVVLSVCFLAVVCCLCIFGFICYLKFRSFLSK